MEHLKLMTQVLYLVISPATHACDETTQLWQIQLSADRTHTSLQDCCCLFRDPHAPKPSTCMLYTLGTIYACTTRVYMLPLQLCALLTK